MARAVTLDRGGRTVLGGVSLTVGPQSRMGMIGPNGVGKSSLLQVLVGVLAPSGGEVVRLALARSLLAGPALLILDDVAGVLDEASRTRVAAVLAARRDLAVVEATVDTPLLATPTTLVRVAT